MAEEYRCFVGGLAWATDDVRLEGAFKPYGQVVDSKVVNDRETGRSRGFGFVTFSDEKSMRDAIESLNGSELDGRNITVNQAQSRGSSGGGGGGGGGGNYRSGSGGGYSNSSSKYGGSGGGYGRSTSDNRSYGGSRSNSYGSRDGSFGGSRDGSFGGSRGDGSSKTWRSQRNGEY